MRRISFTLAALLAAAPPVAAQDIDGLYKPEGARWSCRADEVGMDGGALAIREGRLEGVENSCDLGSTGRVGGGWVEFRATCSGEGATARRTITLRRHPLGLEFRERGYRYVWERCR
ncbi:hypothetical protein JQC91_10160 [Jannaschia sp. Os4]|uniref:hypothetical protein n=1 Tax=Jannaschia sp. Os4 TaxID=2807617 RepID=UPI00193A0FA1|nr:hypothetical protein [Jannaschia sp. Os4]MBM2576667.1 hypothetical protein [Jannaschia sp. Os4]